MQIILASDQAKKIESRFELVEISKRERLLNAAKKFGIWFGIAVAAVFIPIFHFVLVPVLLLAAAVMGMKAYKNRFEVRLLDHGPCIACGKPMQEVFLLGAELQFDCNHCYAQYFVQR